jgi:probable rRNA maturation factor
MVKALQGHKDRSQRPAIRGQDVRPAHQRTLSLLNRQRVYRMDLRLLRRIVQALLRRTCPNGTFDLVVYLVAGPEMTRLNEAFLHHKGSTDVITFDYAERVGQASCLSTSGARVQLIKDRRDACPTLLHGEIFVCLDEAVSQARRFHTTWQSELVRYIVHGVLHLLGYDDRDARTRRRMKGMEDTLVHQLARQFDFRSLGNPEPPHGFEVGGK